MLELVTGLPCYGRTLGINLDPNYPSASGEVFTLTNRELRRLLA
jgi:hypothetical protein